MQNLNLRAQFFGARLRAVLRCFSSFAKAARRPADGNKIRIPDHAGRNVRSLYVIDEILACSPKAQQAGQLGPAAVRAGTLSRSFLFFLRDLVSCICPVTAAGSLPFAF